MLITLKKGFTLIELLAVIVILAIILAISVPTITSLIESSRLSAYKNNEKILVKAAKTYMAVNNSEYPKNVGDIRIIDLTELNTNQFIGEIKDSKDNSTCNGRVVIRNKGNGEYSYSPYLKCDNYYETVPDYISNGLVVQLDGYDEPVNGYWQDKSGNNNHAKLMNMSGIETSGYDSNKKAYAFDGINDYMTFQSVLVKEKNMTYSVVSKFNNDFPYGKFLSIIGGRMSSGGGSVFGLYFSKHNTNTLNLWLQMDIFGYGKVIKSNITMNDLHAVAVSISETLVRVYYNGDLVYSTSITQPATVTYSINTQLGFVSTNYLDGLIYSTLIYNRALSDEEILTNYTVEKQRYGL